MITATLNDLACAAATAESAAAYATASANAAENPAQIRAAYAAAAAYGAAAAEIREEYAVLAAEFDHLSYAAPIPNIQISAAAAEFVFQVAPAARLIAAALTAPAPAPAAYPAPANFTVEINQADAGIALTRAVIAGMTGDPGYTELLDVFATLNEKGADPYAETPVPLTRAGANFFYRMMG